jgi:MFS family permease
VLDALRSRFATLAAAAPRVYWYVWWGTLINRLGGFVVQLLTIYLIKVRGLSVAEAGGVSAVFGAGAIGASIAGGQMSDRLGRRITLLVSLFGGAIVLAVLAFQRDLTSIAVMVGLFGFVSELYRPAVLAIVADVVPAPQRVHAYGLLHWVINIGFAVATVVGGLLAEVDFTILFIADAATMAAYGVIVLVGVPETLPRARVPVAAAPAAATAPPRRQGPAPPGRVAPPQGGAKVLQGPAPPGRVAPPQGGAKVHRWWRDGPFAVVVGLTFLLGLLPFQADAALSAHMLHQGFSPAGYAAVLSVNGFLVVVFQPWITARTAQLDTSRVVIAAALLYGIGISMHGLAAQLWAHAGAVVVWTLGEILEAPARSTMIAAMAPAEARGRYQGAIVLAFGVSRLVGPKLGTWTWQHRGPATLWTACLLLGILIALGHAAAAPARRRRLGI